MTRTTWVGTLILVVGQGLGVAACGDDGASFPTATAPSPTGAPSTGSGPITGVVSDTAFRRLGGASVEVLDGPRAGTSTNADATGAFSFPGTFDNATRFRASMPGHVPVTSTVSPLDPPRQIYFYLALLGGPPSMAGDYTLTITADSACVKLPEEARTRTYTAAVRPHPWMPATYFEIAIGGAAFLDAFDLSERATLAVAGDYVALWLGNDTEPALVERLSTSTYVAFGATASATMPASATSLSTTFRGFVDYCAMPSDQQIPMVGFLFNCAPERSLVHEHCQADGHRLTLTRR